MDKNPKSVLMVDDEEAVHEHLKVFWNEASQSPDCPYIFTVDTALTSEEGIRKSLVSKYDVVILDIVMSTRESLALADAARLKGEDVRTITFSAMHEGLGIAYAISEKYGLEKPVKIVHTSYPNLSNVVRAMQNGAWDVIPKFRAGSLATFGVEWNFEDFPARRVIRSAIDRLRYLDLRHELRQCIGREWLPYNSGKLREEYGDKLVALWHKPEIRVIASAADAFTLSQLLAQWREEHESWEQPFLMRVSPKKVL